MLRLTICILAFFFLSETSAKGEDCNEIMKTYSININRYSTSVSELNRSELSQLLAYLKNTTDDHIQCSVYNDESIEKNKLYKAIFLSNTTLISVINAYIDNPYDIFAKTIKKEYGFLQKSANGFNK